MPEKTTISRREQTTKLSDAERFQQIVHVHCKLCRTKRIYLIKDVMTLIGDVPVYSMAQSMRCDHCGNNEYLEARCAAVHGSDFGKLKIRRLEGIKTVKVPIWREDVL
jgi:hypothetical protein